MGITILLFFILFMLDQILKFVMVKQGLNNPIYIFGDKKGYFIKLNLTYNPGAAFGMGGTESTIFFTIVSLVATVALIIICTKFNDWKRNKVQAVALTMTLAGCVGNLYDRFMTAMGVMDGVVDMIHFYPFEWLMEDVFHMSYGIFNLADLFLVTGICVFAFDYIFFSERKKRKWQESE